MLLTAKGTIARLGPEDLALVDFDGRVLDGSLQPVAAEIVAMHAVIYRERPDVHSVIHTYSPLARCSAPALIIRESVVMAPCAPGTRLARELLY
ncbi:MAG TPA: class II aldolase/adducin family protein [Chloroflexota bacterium]|nr:class II aldolase/adducin family protein [Chloroflexota bacterium]